MAKRRRVSKGTRTVNGEIQPVRTKHHRGRRRKKTKKQKAALLLSNLILIVAVVVFLISGYKLLNIGKGYQEGRHEYKEVMDLAVEYDDKQEKFRVDFDKLMEINSDTIGWIRFYPEPSIISYPIVQGNDNDLYLHKTFSANENTLGTIFLDYLCEGDFTGKNSIIYGHRMKDGSMFRQLEKYEEQSFWEENPYFYIYTPDGKEVTYHIYSAGVVDDNAKTYTVSFANESEYQSYIDYTMSTADYETGVEVTIDDQIVTLSTCTSAGDDYRFVVHGVKIREAELED